MDTAQSKTRMNNTAFSTTLLKWYECHGRKSLPWHKHRDPYGIWVSEIMLQQTQVQTVIPYYMRFMKRFEDIASLANASEDEVLHHWSGLGYYARARNLHKAAKRIRDHHQGKFPDDFDAVVSLPGIGRSTAGAILAFSFGQRHAILDGNVKRVLTRYFAIEGYPGKKSIENHLWQLADQLTPTDQVSQYTQAIMDLGAMLCTRSKPRCSICPINRHCQAKKRAQQTLFPYPKPKVKRPVKSIIMLIIQDQANGILLLKRPPSGIWGGLWSLPEITPPDVDVENWCAEQLQIQINVERTLPNVRHVFSHYELDIQPVVCKKVAVLPRIGDEPAAKWYDMAATATIGVPSIVPRILQLLTDLPHQ